MDETILPGRGMGKPECRDFYTQAQELAAHPIVVAERKELENIQQCISEKLSRYIAVTQKLRSIYQRQFPELTTWTGGDGRGISTQHRLEVNSGQECLVSRIIDTHGKLIDQVIFYFDIVEKQVILIGGYKINDKLVAQLTGFKTTEGSFVNLKRFDTQKLWKMSEWKQAERKILAFFKHDAGDLEEEESIINERSIEIVWGVPNRGLI